MKNPVHPVRRLTAAALISAAVFEASAANFSSGSTGADGPLNVTSNTVVQLPADGVLNYTTITVGVSNSLTFKRNVLNTPVYLLATGDVVIDGSINVNGGTGSVAPLSGGLGGPGGFDGGAGGFTSADNVLPGGAGMGPGGGLPGPGGNYNFNGAGAGAYGARPPAANALDGVAYGSRLLIPLVGGSGGGGVNGDPNRGGGGGGGAVLVASNTRITVSSTGSIVARSGEAVEVSRYNSGSGGAVRLVAPRVYGTGTLDVRSTTSTVNDQFRSGGAGRIRVDSIFKVEPTNPAGENLSLVFVPSPSASVGSTMIVFPPSVPSLSIVSAAGQAIAEGALAPVQVQLPFGSNTNQLITVRARNFGADVPIRVSLIPANGDPISYDTNIVNTAVNPAEVTVNAGFPLNALVNVQVWTR
ncbi:MAG: hypothetical protein RIS76_2293 [Verrucomicrobiota bacterium]